MAKQAIRWTNPRHPAWREAARKASKARLLDAMREAARIVAAAQVGAPARTWSRAYILGAADCSSDVVRACLFSAWGE